MTAIAHRQKQRMIVALVCGIVAAMILPAGLVVGYNSVLNSNSGTNVNSVRTLRIPDTPVALLATVNGSQEITTVSVIALSSQSMGGTIISLPAKASAEISLDEAPRRISDSYSANDISSFVADVEGLLDVSFSAVGVLSQDQMKTLFANVGSVEILLDSDVRQTNLDGATITVAKTGKATVETTTFVDILLAREIDQAESQRFNHHKSVWTAIANTVGLGLKIESVPSDIDQLDDIEDFVGRLLSGPIQFWQFAATPILQGDQNPNSLDMYSLDRAEVTMIMASVAPTSITGSGISGSIAVQVDSPFNDPAVSREIVLRLLAMGLNVALVREVPGPPKETSSLRYVDPQLLSGVTAIAKFVGEIAAEKTFERAQGIDLQLIIGKSFADHVENFPNLEITGEEPTDE